MLKFAENIVSGLKDTWRAAALYVAVAVLTDAIIIAIMTAAAPEAPGQGNPLRASPLMLAIEIGASVLNAWIATVAFARIGRYLDRPLWKVQTDWEALRRFFLPWLVMILGTITLMNLLGRLIDASESSAPPVMLLFLMVMLEVLIVPLGACIMFHGKFEWGTLNEALAPLAKQGERTLPLILLSFFLTFMFFVLSSAIPRVTLPIVSALAALWDCFMFVGIWFVCMTDRETRDEVDLDF
ncbi:MAG: hypothetical protein KJ052_04750 [Candidatus Hydrogenedentes bacterium]|nr:hypothetical protein [Candidatus Hydrogenedentota bacterium]